MATLIRAIATYRPRIYHRRTLDLDALAARLAPRTLVTRSLARLVLEELAEEIARALLRGEAIALPGIGRIGLDIRMDGRLRPTFTADPRLRRRLAREGAFTGTVLQRESIGLDRDALIARWNREHPDDPVRRTGDTEPRRRDRGG